MCLLMTAAQVAHAQIASSPPAGERRELWLAITTQMRGTIDAQLLYSSGKPGGFAHLAPAIRAARQEHPDMLLLDAGEALRGAPESNPPPGNDAWTPPALQAMAALRYDAAVLSVRELDWGRERLKSWLALSGFPWLASNISEQGTPWLDGFAMVERAGLRIAILGLSAPRLAGSDPTGRQRLEFQDMLRTARQQVPLLRGTAHADLILALTDSGMVEEADREAALIAGLPLPNGAGQIADSDVRLDLIVASSSRRRSRTPEERDRPLWSYATTVLPAQPGALSVAHLEVVRQSGQWRIERMERKLRWPERTSDGELSRALRPVLERTRRDLARQTRAVLTGRSSRTRFARCSGALGHAAAQRALGSQAAPYSLLPMLWRYQPFRKQDREHPITRGQVFRWIQPDDTLVQAQLSGRQMELLLGPYVRFAQGWRTQPAQVLYPGGLEALIAGRASELQMLRDQATGTNLDPYTKYPLLLARYHWDGGGGSAAKALIAPDQLTARTGFSLREAVFALLEAPDFSVPEPCRGMVGRWPEDGRQARATRVRTPAR